MDSQRSEVVGLNCHVCFNAYNIRVGRRPRVLFCGHTFCSNCITNNLQQNQVTCPSCRSKHQATSCTDFPVNFSLESVSQNPTSDQTDTNESLIPPIDTSRSLSRKIRSMRHELCSTVEGVGASSRDFTSQLHQYISQLDDWNMEQQEGLELYLAIAHQYEDMIKRVAKESVMVKEIIREEDEERQKMEVARDNLIAASTAHEILPALEEVDLCCDVIEKMTWGAKKQFPNIELITHLKQQKGRSKTDVLKVSTCRIEEDSVSGVTVTDNDSASKEEEDSQEEEERTTTIQETITRVLENVYLRYMDQAVQTHVNTSEQGIQTHVLPELKVRDLIDMSPLIKEILQSNKVFAVQENKRTEEKRYARITLDENQRLCLHVLGNPESPPHDSFLLQYHDVRSLVNISCRQAFLDLGVEGRSLGRLLIRLSPDGNFARNFSILCMGEMGPSYANSNILGARENGHDMYECVEMGEYQRNDRRGGKALVPGVDWRSEWWEDIYKRPYVKGSVTGYLGTEAEASQFFIYTRDNPCCHLYGSFGMVEEGLHVLIEAISQHPNVKEINIMDCGVLLSR